MGLGPVSQPQAAEVRASLGVVAALSAEGRCLAGASSQTELLLRVSGMGPDRARKAAEGLVEGGAQALTSWGIAAGLASGLKAGSVMLARCVVAGNAQITVDEAWHQRLLSSLAPRFPVHTGPIAHTSMVLRSTEEKGSLRAKTEAVAADMESLAVAQVARRARVPFIAIRAIADPLDLGVPQCALGAVDEYGLAKLAKLLSGLARSPLELASLLELGMAFNRALATLRRVAKFAGPLLCVKTGVALTGLFPVPAARVY